ncbi:peptide/nickel transport system substrate-binding protein [Butyrivibrio fibrisolvens DSM 3071]|uniref:Peptide/nickel transport system substrate-binding protein n=1 Tax=Butyrivibrio fibrisolvens DSM 3071 TaxID=1121131 RepID=A0A1M5TTC9_BUTFI|nr:ABC transporter substrate-binding protein [Butyrivibrio fibrisolvens]SHH53941.1 peptide/nickel transport system substrate-binding protein [Butyrivibrio fibrisolvens DSM 3071]
MKKNVWSGKVARRGLAAICALTMAAATMLTGCGKKSGEVFTVGIPQDLDSLDPHIAQAAGTREVLFNIFEGLVKPDEKGNMNPAIASSYEISDDATEYTFTIRENVHFHNNEVVTADDVVASLQRFKDTGAAIFDDVSAIEKVDDSHVKISLSKPNTEFLSYCTVAIMPKDIKDPETNPIGTGPYKFVSRTALENLVVEKFDDYWDKENAAHIQNVVFKVEANPDSIVTDLEGGSIDMYARITSDQAEQLSESFQIYEGGMNLVQALYVNNAVEPFDNELVRQALCYAIDPQEIMNFVSGGAGVEIGSAMFPSFDKYFDESLNDTYNQDVEKAKELLAQAGYADGFTFTIKVPSNYTQHIDTAEVIAEQLEVIGVTAVIQKIDWNTWLDEVYNNKVYEATILGFDASTLNASALLYRYTSDAKNNMFNYSNADYDKAFAAAQATVDEAEQIKYYKECEKILSQTAAAVYIQDLPCFVALNSKYTGYTFYPLYVQDIAKIRLAE